MLGFSDVWWFWLVPVWYELRPFFCCLFNREETLYKKLGCLWYLVGPVCITYSLIITHYRYESEKSPWTQNPFDPQMKLRWVQLELFLKLNYLKLNESGLDLYSESSFDWTLVEISNYYPYTINRSETLNVKQQPSSQNSDKKKTKCNNAWMAYDPKNPTSDLT